MLKAKMVADTTELNESIEEYRELINEFHSVVERLETKGIKVDPAIQIDDAFVDKLKTKLIDSIKVVSHLHLLQVKIRLLAIVVSVLYNLL